MSDSKWRKLEYRREYEAELVRWDLALALVDARKRAGLTQQQVATLTGVSQAYVAKLESGNANPTVGQVGSMLGALGLRLGLGLRSLTDERLPLVDDIARADSPAADAANGAVPLGASAKRS